MLESLSATDLALMILLALIGASGAFFLFNGPLERKANPLAAGAQMLSGGPTKPSPLSLENLDEMLHQAELDVSAMAFLRVGAIGAIVCAGVMYVVTNAITVAVVAFVGFFFIYWWWLVQRRDERRMKYEEAIADWADIMSIGSEGNPILESILTKTAAIAPPACRDDAKWVDEQITYQNISGTEALQQLCQRRHSAMLSLMTQTLVVFSKAGSTKPLSQILAPLSESLRARSSSRNEAEADLTLARGQLSVVTLAPIAFVALLRSANPESAAFYGTPFGQFLIIAAVAWAFAGYYLADRILSVVRRTVDITVDINRYLSGIVLSGLKKKTHGLGTGPGSTLSAASTEVE